MMLWDHIVRLQTEVSQLRWWQTVSSYVVCGQVNGSICLSIFVLIFYVLLEKLNWTSLPTSGDHTGQNCEIVLSPPSLDVL